MGRKASREVAMKLLYQFEFQNDNKEEQIMDAQIEEGLHQKDMEYVRDVVGGVHQHISSIDEQIEKNAKGWKLARISKVDLSILRLALYEIHQRKDIPYNVTVNEAVELAKKYSSEDSGAFINGILGSVTKGMVLPNQEGSTNQEGSPNPKGSPNDIEAQNR
jgi:transcription antitermination protein NusB